MKTARRPWFLAAAIAAACFSGSIASAEGSGRLVVGGRGAALVVDALYAFPDLRPRLAATVKPDQGLGLFLAAVDADFPAKATLDRSAGAEAYAALKPDLVLLKSYMKPSLGAALEGLGLKTMYLDLETPEAYRADLLAVGEAFGQRARAAELAAYYDSLQADTERRVAGLPRPRTLLVQATAGGWEAAPAAWIQTRLVALAGGEPVWAGAVPGGGWARVSGEQIAAWDPEAVVAVSYAQDPGAAAEAFRTDPLLARLSAAKAGRVFALPQDFYSWDQPDSRWILGLRRIAAFLHPSAFRGVDPGAEAREFFRFVYGLDGARFDAAIAPRLRGDHGLR